MRVRRPAGAGGARPALKVCCVRSAEEALLAAEGGASFIGLVGAMPSGPGPISDPVIREVAASAPRTVMPVLLTSRDTADSIADHVRSTGVSAVQIVRRVPPEVRRELRSLVPGLTVLQVVHVQGPGSTEEAVESASWSDYLLLDSGRPSATVPELGGTGRTHDWSVSAEIVRRSPIPVLLAGGLRPENVAEAVGAVKPFGVDACTGLRDARGRLVPARLEAFRKALEACSGTGRPGRGLP